MDETSNAPQQHGEEWLGVASFFTEVPRQRKEWRSMAEQRNSTGKATQQHRLALLGKAQRGSAQQKRRLLGTAAQWQSIAKQRNGMAIPF